MGSFGVASSLMAELRDICKGLLLTWAKGFQKILLKFDSTTAIHLLNHRINEWHLLAPLVEDWRLLLERAWWIIPRHVLRDGNQVVDRLANLSGTLLSQELLILESPPSTA
ncbi:hypothetical protein Syun_004240 [Stephania yunnanensis]|uniref:RNase H type-1 domain-containing protein n=1 Tax=Stephania yunnanensis TaxID=152371 RepID=A0AAP0L417_9MAGN